MFEFRVSQKKAAQIAVQEPMLKEIWGHPEAQACDKDGSGRDLPVRFNNVTRWTDTGVIQMFLVRYALVRYKVATFC